MKMNKGKFITFEGIDGAGKTTFLPWFQKVLSGYLMQLQKKVVLTREPGGTPLGEALRQLVLNETMTIETEALLMFAARCEHIQQVILPHLQQGNWVLSDRFTDASFAYQGGGRGLALSRLSVLEQWVQQGLTPDLTILFDLAPAIAQERRKSVRDPDHFEQQDCDFFQKVREVYLSRAAAEPHRFCIIDAQLSITQIQVKLTRVIEQLVA